MLCSCVCIKRRKNIPLSVVCCLHGSIASFWLSAAIYTHILEHWLFSITWKHFKLKLLTVFIRWIKRKARNRKRRAYEKQSNQTAMCISFVSFFWQFFIKSSNKLSDSRKKSEIFYASFGFSLVITNMKYYSALCRYSPPPYSYSCKDALFFSFLLS